MNILIAPDSFKGTFPADAIAGLIRQALPLRLQNRATIQPMADGGEGTASILAAAMHAKPRQISVTAPLGDKVVARYAIAEAASGDTAYFQKPARTAFIELASASGLMLSTQPLQPTDATTFGTGELLVDALNQGVTRLVLGLGGSATSDGGAGILTACGVKLLDKHNRPIPLGNRGLGELERIDFGDTLRRFHAVEMLIAADVHNPLLGRTGAIQTFGKQKGVTDDELARFEKRLAHFAEIIEKAIGIRLSNELSSGAAGGAGFALMALGATRVSGAKLVADLTGLEEKIKHADLVITGEGKFDATSLDGKVAGYVGALCRTFQKRCWVVAGTASTEHLPQDRLFERIVPVFDSPPESLSRAVTETPARLREKFSQIVFN
jgi:glycerate 2-kinase